MILLLLGFAGVAGLAAVAESLPLGAEPRPVLWLSSVVVFPLAARTLEAAAGRRWARRTRLLLFAGAYAAILYPLGWAGYTLEYLGWRGKPLPSLVLLLSPAAALALWASPWLYRLEMIAARAGLRVDPPSFGRWLADSARIILVPLSILLSVSFAAGWFAELRPFDDVSGASQSAGIALGAAALLCLLAASPLLVLLAWRTETFPSGDLRGRLEQLARRLGVKVRAIRVWDERTRRVVNACAVGVVPGTRAVIFTRGIRDLLSDEEIGAVFSHEAAHLARGHLLAYAVLGLAFLLSLAPLETALEAAPAWLAWSILGVYAVVYWVVGLGAISRRLETEADIAAANVAGFGAYCSALRKAACLIGPPAQRNGWRHFSLERRLEIIEEASANPQRARHVLDSCRRLRAGLFVLLGVSISAFAWNTAHELTQEASAARSIPGALALMDEAEAMRPLLAYAAARKSGASAVTRWIGRDPAAIEADCRAIVEAARRCAEKAEKASPADAAGIRERIESLR